MDPEPPSFIILQAASPEGYGGIIISIVVLLILLICSALVSGAEVAFFSLGPKDRDDLALEPNKKSEVTLELLNKPKDLLATILIANNFVNVGIVILSSFIFNSLYVSEASPILKAVLEIGVITFVILLIGEVIPKVYANRNSLKLALFMSRPLKAIGGVPPVSWMRKALVSGTEFINKAAKKRSVDISTDELEQALALTKEDSDSDEDHKILEGIVKFGNTDVKQIMRSRVDVCAIDDSKEFSSVMETIIETGYSRLPVYKEKFDEVIGILYVKDLLPFIDSEKDFKWQELLRPPFFVPENKKIDDLLKEFQEMKMHMAVVVDEYGGASGVVTLEDVLEEIVGDITDEFDDDDLVYSKINNDTYLFEGKTPLVDMYKVLDIDGKEFESTKGESDSIAGFIIEQAGKILRNNESVTFSDFKFIVEASDKKRVKTVKVIRNVKENENEED